MAAWRVTVRTGATYSVSDADLAAFVAVLAANKAEFTVRRAEPGMGGTTAPPGVAQGAHA